MLPASHRRKTSAVPAAGRARRDPRSGARPATPYQPISSAFLSAIHTTSTFPPLSRHSLGSYAAPGGTTCSNFGSPYGLPPKSSARRRLPSARLRLTFGLGAATSRFSVPETRAERTTITEMPEKPVAYLETSFVSYLAARLSQKARVQQDQLISHRWWQEHRHRFELVVSPAVVIECADGDPALAQRRLEYLATATELDPHPSVDVLRDSLLRPAGPLPPNAAVDAEHVAYAAIYRCDYLLTWNVRHIVNPELRRIVDNIIRSKNYEPAVICTPALWFPGGPLA